MNVRDIIIKHLRDIGADGLASKDCGCGVDDLAPCMVYWACLQCEPARKKTATEEEAKVHDVEVGDDIYVIMNIDCKCGE